VNIALLLQIGLDAAAVVMDACLRIRMPLRRRTPYGRRADRLAHIKTDLRIRNRLRDDAAVLIGDALQGNYLLREKQYTQLPELEIAKKIVKNKVKNQLSLLQEIREKSDSFKENILRMKELLSKIEEVESDDSLRGLE